MTTDEKAAGENLERLNELEHLDIALVDWNMPS